MHFQLTFYFDKIFFIYLNRFSGLSSHLDILRFRFYWSALTSSHHTSQLLKSNLEGLNRLRWNIALRLLLLFLLSKGSSEGLNSLYNHKICLVMSDLDRLVKITLGQFILVQVRLRQESSGHFSKNWGCSIIVQVGSVRLGGYVQLLLKIGDSGIDTHGLKIQGGT